MAKHNHYISAKIKPSFSGVIEKIRDRKNSSGKNFIPNDNILKRLFHPDYILFDWEYFSRELEFE